MATQAKGEHGPGKEKRGTSPSYMRHSTDAAATSSRRSPSAPSPSRPPDKKQITTTSTSDKRTPNYLKPTLSSSPNPSSSTQANKTQTSSAQKPTLNRRRSFDKPPSPNSLLLKSHTMLHPKEKTHVVRSSSSNIIMPKTSSSFSKPHQDNKFLKAHNKDAGGKFHSVTKKTTPVKKQNVDATTTSTATVPTKASATSTPDLTADSAPLVECHKKDQEYSSVTDVEEEREVLLTEESKIELPPHVSALDEDQKEDIKPDTGGNSQVRVAETVKNENEEIKTLEPLIVLENQNESLDVHMEGVEDGEEILEETRKDESHESHQEEEIVDGDEEEGEESATENSKDEKSVDKEEEVGEGNLRESKEREKVEDIVTEAKTHMENTGGKQQQRQGKETQAYNDVIEETASKLREERKNKVKALAGAFETVISLQKPEA